MKRALNIVASVAIALSAAILAEPVKPLDQLKTLSDLTPGEQVLVLAYVLDSGPRIKHTSSPILASRTQRTSWDAKQFTLPKDSYRRIARVVPGFEQKIAQGREFRIKYIEQLIKDVNLSFYKTAGFSTRTAERVLATYLAALKEHNQTKMSQPADRQIALNNARQQVIDRYGIDRNEPEYRWDQNARRELYRLTDWNLDQTKAGNADSQLPPDKFKRWCDAELTRLSKEVDRMIKSKPPREFDQDLWHSPLLRTYFTELVSEAIGLHEGTITLLKYASAIQSAQPKTSSSNTRLELSQEKVISSLRNRVRYERDLDRQRTQELFGDENRINGLYTKPGKHEWLFDLEWWGLKPDDKTLAKNPTMRADNNFWVERADVSQMTRGWLWENPDSDKLTHPVAWRTKQRKKLLALLKNTLKVAAASTVLAAGVGTGIRSMKQPILTGITQHELSIPDADSAPKNELIKKQPLFTFVPLNAHSLAELPTEYEVLNRHDRTELASRVEIPKQPREKADFIIQSQVPQTSDGGIVAILSPEGYAIDADLIRPNDGKVVPKADYHLWRMPTGEVIAKLRNGNDIGLVFVKAYYTADPSVVFPNHGKTEDLRPLPLSTVALLADKARQNGFDSIADSYTTLVDAARASGKPIYPSDISSAQRSATLYSSLETKAFDTSNLLDPFSAYTVFQDAQGVACFECDGAAWMLADQMEAAQRHSGDFSVQFEKRVLVTRPANASEVHDLHMRIYATPNGTRSAVQRVVLDPTPGEFDPRHIKAERSQTVDTARQNPKRPEQLPLLVKAPTPKRSSSPLDANRPRDAYFRPEDFEPDLVDSNKPKDHDQESEHREITLTTEDKIALLVDTELKRIRKLNKERHEQLDALKREKAQLFKEALSYSILRVQPHTPLGIVARATKQLEEFIVGKTGAVLPDDAELLNNFERSAQNLRKLTAEAAMTRAGVTLNHLKVEPQHAFEPLLRSCEALIEQIATTQYSQLESEDPEEIRRAVLARSSSHNSRPSADSNSEQRGGSCDETLRNLRT